jgi:hypothetical protein
MKKSLLLCALLAGFAGHAQTTIPGAHFDLPVTPDSVHSVSFVTGSTPIAMPAHGTNQNWDYRGLPAGSDIKDSYSAYDNNPNFPNADAMHSYDPSLGALTLEGSRAYYMKNTGGFYYQGFETEDHAYSIGAASGHPDDTLWTLNTFNYYGTNVPLIEYPVTAASEWSYNYDAYTDFEVTVTLFAINRDPGQHKQTVEQYDTVVGWGTLSMDVTGYDDVPALLVKETVVYTDSFFLNNQPAPPTLLAAFGLTQGQVTTYHQYHFMVYDAIEAKLRPTALTLFLNNNQTEVMGGTHDKQLFNPMSTDKFTGRIRVKLYPNPAVNSDVLNIELGNPADSKLNVELYHMGGVLVNSSTVEPGAIRHTIALKNNAAGFYIIRMTNAGGEVVYTDKILKQ